MDEIEKKPKRGLLLTGGGAKGAFQIGALRHLIGDMGRKYDVVTGFSVGALSGAMVAQGDFEALYDIWHGMRSIRDVFGGNPRFYRGLLSMKPLRKLAESVVDIEKLRLSGTKLYFTTVDLQAGKLVECDQNSEPFVDWLLASATIPGVFPPMEIDGGQFVDGGVLATQPLSPAIRAGVDEIDVIPTRPLSDWRSDARIDTLVECSVRSLELAQAEMVRVDIDKCMAINEMVEKWREVKGDAGFIEGYILNRTERRDVFPFKKLRFVKLNIIEPPHELLGPLEFGKERIEHAMDAGYKKAVDLFPNIMDN